MPKHHLTFVDQWCGSKRYLSREYTRKVRIRTANRNLSEQASALFNSWFIEYSHFGGEMPEDWMPGILDDIIHFSNGYAFKSKELLDTPDL